MKFTKHQLIDAATRGWEGIGFNHGKLYKRDQNEEICSACFLGAAAIGLNVPPHMLVMELFWSPENDRGLSLYRQITRINDSSPNMKECLRRIEALEFPQ